MSRDPHVAPLLPRTIFLTTDELELDYGLSGLCNTLAHEYAHTIDFGRVGRGVDPIIWSVDVVYGVFFNESWERRVWDYGDRIENSVNAWFTTWEAIYSGEIDLLPPGFSGPPGPGQKRRQSRLL